MLPITNHCAKPRSASKAHRTRHSQKVKREASLRGFSSQTKNKATECHADQRIIPTLPMPQHSKQPAPSLRWLGTAQVPRGEGEGFPFALTFLQTLLAPLAFPSDASPVHESWEADTYPMVKMMDRLWDLGSSASWCLGELRPLRLAQLVRSWEERIEIRRVHPALAQ
ncbi:hypothetical protein VTK56DRAFT_1287 [Thermocarpiscus australiensis]